MVTIYEKKVSAGVFNFNKFI